MQRVHSMPFGAEVTPTGVRFALWAPTARQVGLVLDGAEYAMPEIDEGWRSLVIPGARAGGRYRFRIDDDLLVPDPASRFQPDDIRGASLVVDPAAYDWSDAVWQGRPWEETVLYEAHVGTATPEGTYASLGGKLEELRDLGITAIELLPLSDFPGRSNWGYDGVLPYAPDSAYGTPEDLKAFVDRAHALGLMVFLDVVYNHFGPAGNFLHAYAETFFTDRHKTPWGAGINFDGADGAVVRDFFVHNAIYWLEEFHVDGLRFDAVHAILDDSERHIIAEIAERARTALPGREVHLVLENEANEARWLERKQNGRPHLHTAQWADDIHNSWHPLLTGESEGYYEDFAGNPLEHLGRSLAEGFAYQGEPSVHQGGAPRGTPSAHLPPSAFVSFLQNHDQTGNRAFGERLSHLVPPERLDVARAGLLLSPQVPMLYMGEDWSASTPFLYFVDFSDDEQLSRAVRDGRRREFAKFTSFAEQDGKQIPDPTSEDAFKRSVLQWDEASRPPHADVRAEIRRLLQIRQTEIVPLTSTAFLGATRAQPRTGCLDVIWHFGGGRLRFLANFGDDTAELQAGEREQVLWVSRSADYSGNRIRLPSWTCAFLKSGPS